MTAIGIVTMLSQVRGGYGLAGAIAAVFALATALIAPQLSRLVDRMGQSKILLPAAAVSATAIGALLLCSRFGAPDWTLFVCALFAGCMPSMLHGTRPLDRAVQRITEVTYGFFL